MRTNIKHNIGGRRLTKAQREDVIQRWLENPDAASAYAVSLGLSPEYAYKLAWERGVAPRLSKYWGQLREEHA